MASGSSNMTTYKSRILASTPNNTTTFLRGDNTWSSILTGRLTLDGITISNTTGTEHINFSRSSGHNSPNYLNVPVNSALCVSVGGAGGANIVAMFESAGILPYSNNTKSVGTNDYKWNAMYATTFYGALSGNATTATTASYLQTPHLAGFSTDQYGNFIHQRTTDSDGWNVCKNDGNAALSVKWETRAVTVYGDLTIGGNVYFTGLGEGLEFVSDNNYFGTNADARIIQMVDTNPGANTSSVDGGIIIRAVGRNGSTDTVRELLRIRGTNNDDNWHSGTFQWKTKNIVVETGTSPVWDINAKEAWYISYSSGGNKWDANNVASPWYSDYGSSGRSCSNMPSGWSYGTILTFGCKGSLNSDLSSQFCWDVEHATDNPGQLWFRTYGGKTSGGGWKKWARMFDSQHNCIFENVGTGNRYIQWQMADNDFARILVGGSSNSGYLEIATADDGTEPIYVRQYSGTFSSIQRSLILLDENGYTRLPGRYWGGSPKYTNSALYFELATHEHLTSGAYYRPLIGSSEQVGGYGYGNSWTIGLYSNGNDTNSGEVGLYFGTAWDTNATTANVWRFRRDGVTQFPSNISLGSAFYVTSGGHAYISSSLSIGVDSTAYNLVVNGESHFQNQLLAYNKSTGRGDVYSGSLQLREYNCETTSCTHNWYNAPSITFHWGGRYVVKLGVFEGYLKLDNTRVVLNDSQTYSINISGNAATATSLNSLVKVVKADDFNTANVSNRWCRVAKLTGTRTGRNYIVSLFSSYNTPHDFSAVFSISCGYCEAQIQCLSISGSVAQFSRARLMRTSANTSEYYLEFYYCGNSAYDNNPMCTIMNFDNADVTTYKFTATDNSGTVDRTIYLAQTGDGTRNGSYVSSNSFSCALRKIGQVVTCNLCMNITTTPPSGATLVTLPEGFYPKNGSYIIVGHLNESFASVLYVNTNGTITRCTAGGQASNSLSDWCVGQATWLTNN